MISELCWKDQLKRKIASLWVHKIPPRVAILGVGSHLHADDVAGVMIVRTLKQNGVYGRYLRVINAGISPENVIGKLRSFKPDLVLIVDTAWMGQEPGCVMYLDPGNATGLSFSTHTLPMQVMSKYLTNEIGCQVGILGIQPIDVSFFAPLSPIVRKSLKKILPDLVEILTPILISIKDNRLHGHNCHTRMPEFVSKAPRSLPTR